MTGIELIETERRRQITEKGYTAEHDMGIPDNELEMASLAYICSSIGQKRAGMKIWPWLLPFYKPKARVRDLVKAGALIAAAIDRLQNMDNQE